MLSRGIFMKSRVIAGHEDEIVYQSCGGNSQVLTAYTDSLRSQFLEFLFAGEVEPHDRYGTEE